MIEKEKIASIIEQLDETISKDGARVKFDMYGGGPDESMVVANAQGYLRLGIEFLKAGIMRVEHKNDKRAEELNVNLDYMVTTGSPISFDIFERDENVQDIPRAEHKQAWWISPLIGGVLLLIGLSIVVGLVTIVRWLL